MGIPYPINMDQELRAAILDNLRNLREEVRVNAYRESGNTAFDIFMHGINNLLEEYEE